VREAAEVRAAAVVAVDTVVEAGAVAMAEVVVPEVAEAMAAVEVVVGVEVEATEVVAAVVPVGAVLVAAAEAVHLLALRVAAVAADIRTEKGQRLSDIGRGAFQGCRPKACVALAKVAPKIEE
jgi:hypothetical protein